MSDILIAVFILIASMIPGIGIAVFIWPSLNDIPQKHFRALSRALFMALAFAPAAVSIHGILISALAALVLGLAVLLLGLFSGEVNSGLLLLLAGIWPIFAGAILLSPITILFRVARD